MATKAHLEGNKRYLEKLDHITIRVQGGTKEKIKARAQQEGHEPERLYRGVDRKRYWGKKKRVPDYGTRFFLKNYHI